MTAIALLAVVALIGANALFVATEFALIASRTGPLEDAAADGSRGATMALVARSDLRRQISGAQLGITGSSVVLGIIAQPSIGRLIEPVVGAMGGSDAVAENVGWLVALGLAAAIQMLLGELVPKNLAIAAPEQTLGRLIPIHRAFLVAFAPAIWVLDRLVALAVRPFGQTPVDEIAHAVGAAELSSMLAASRRDGLLQPFEHELLTGALDLGSRPVTAAMIPREDMVTVTRSTTLAEVEAIIVGTGHSRLPVVATGVDDVVGVVHVKDLLRLPVAAQQDSVPLEMIRRMLVVPETSSLEEVLVRMRAARNHLAVVRAVDGRTVGLITMEDVVEELVGEIADETDDPKVPPPAV